MKAIEINGQIKTYDKLPSSWGNVLGGFDLLSDDELKNYGFYNVVIPNYDLRIEDLGELYFDSASETFTKDVLDRTWVQTLSELKQQRIYNFNCDIKIKLQETDWYIIRNQETGDEIPADIISARQALRDQSEVVENEINALTTKKAVMSFDLPNVF
tara:strand:+ start:544 stop:1014 length:471 start_codon:yes stop_codon:yes gene_type:complete